MHLKLDYDLPSYKQEAIQVVIEVKHKTIASSGPLYLSARASLGQKRDTTILNEKHWAYYMALKNSIIIALWKR